MGTSDGDERWGRGLHLRIATVRVRKVNGPERRTLYEQMDGEVAETGVR